MKKRCLSLLFTLTITFPAAVPQAQSLSPTWTFESFADYAYKITGDSLSTDQQYSGVVKDFQAFQIRRALLGMKIDLSDQFALATSVEHNDRVLLTNGQYGIFLKTAFVSWKNIYRDATLNLGLSPSPTWVVGMSERLWGYRGVEKTIADMRNLGGAADMGVLLRGSLGEAKLLNYAAMIANGTFFKPENDKYKKYYAMVNHRFIDHLVTEVYADYEDRASDKYKYTLKGIIAWDSKPITVGVEVVDQLDHCTCPPNGEKNRLGISAYAHGQIITEPEIRAFARYDHWDADTKISDVGQKESFITAGLDFRPLPFVRLIPNIWINSIQPKVSSTPTPDAHVVGRLTFWYSIQ